MREAREYCCDDDAVGVCSNRSDYVRALTTLASLATVNTARPVMGAAGPRLITRVRRLLQEDSMPRSSRLRALSLSALFLMLTATGAPVSMAAAGRSAGALASTPQLSLALGEVPFGYANTQDGSGVSLKLSRTAEPFGYTATVRNLTREPVVAVRFVTVIERARVRPRPPVRVFVSSPVAVILPAESETTVAMPLPTEEQLKEAAAGDGSLQFFFGVVNVRFANGFEWQVTPNTAEVSGDKALGLPTLQLPRAVLTREAGDPSGRVCRDEQGDVYSLGAVVPIQNEPGRFARCEAGRWVERAARR